MDDLKYMTARLGLPAKMRQADASVTSEIPLFLSAGNDIHLIETPYQDFLLASPRSKASLPEIKRTYSQLSKRAELPVAMSVPGAGSRQRAALIRQGVPFISAGREVFLPFLGLAAQEQGPASARAGSNHKLAPRALQAACWSMAHPGSFSPSELVEGTGMSRSQASQALAALEECGLAVREKAGRRVEVRMLEPDAILSEHMGLLSSPVRKSVLVERMPDADRLPDAGETALAGRGMINPPSIEEKATFGLSMEAIEKHRVLEGEEPDAGLVWLQIWRYPPLFKDAHEVDKVSLALSLASADDERVQIEVEGLFGKEYPWQLAR